MSFSIRVIVSTLLSAMSAGAIAAENPGANTLEQRIAALESANRAAAQRGNAFNPATSLILQGGYLRSGREGGHIPGFADAAGHDHSGGEGLSLAESELVISANADDKFSGRMTLALTPGNSVVVEEAYIDAKGLPAGMGVRAGRFYSELGYLNTKHPHAWDFADAPLVYYTMLGGRLADDGVQLRWLAPTTTFIEVGAELLKGASFPASTGEHAGAGAGSVVSYLSLGGDVGASNSWKFGVSHLRADANERGETDPKFTGNSRLNVVDLVWKWAPNGNYKVNNLVLQAEYFQRKEQGEYTTLGLYDAQQSGYYAQTVYQFMPRWRVGVRYDQLKAGDPGAVFAHSDFDPHGHTPKRVSTMVDFSNSEYSRIRVQFNRDDSAEQRNIQWRLQYIVSLGAHGAHRF